MSQGLNYPVCTLWILVHFFGNLCTTTLSNGQIEELFGECKPPRRSTFLVGSSLFMPKCFDPNQNGSKNLNSSLVGWLVSWFVCCSVCLFVCLFVFETLMSRTKFSSCLRLILILWACYIHYCCAFNRLLDTYILLLKQNLQRMNIWLNMAESRIKAQGEIGPGYDDVKKQLEDHQVGWQLFFTSLYLCLPWINVRLYVGDS